ALGVLLPKIAPMSHNSPMSTRNSIPYLSPVSPVSLGQSCHAGLLAGLLRTPGCHLPRFSSAIGHRIRSDSVGSWPLSAWSFRPQADVHVTSQSTSAMAATADPESGQEMPNLRRYRPSACPPKCVGALSGDNGLWKRTALP